MESTNDGFVISDEDLKLRGPGEYFGIKEIQNSLEINSNSFQKKFNRRLKRIATEFQEISEVHTSWLRLRHMNNPIVRLHNNDDW